MFKKIWVLLFFIYFANTSYSYPCARLIAKAQQIVAYTSALNQWQLARRLAITYHRGQWHGNMSWGEHLRTLEDILLQFEFGFRSTFDLKVRTVTKLHDILEDTQINPQILTQRFEREVVESVYQVTFPPNLADVDRGPHLHKKLQAEIAKIVKIVDRSANFEMSIVEYYEQGSATYLTKYLSEWPYFAESAKPNDPRGVKLWEHLNQLMTSESYRENFYIYGSPNRQNYLFPRKVRGIEARKTIVANTKKKTGVLSSGNSGERKS